MNNIFDVAVIGLGVAGSFATFKLTSENKNIKVLGIDLGSGPAKRRWSMGAFLGLLPYSDGKFYQSDLQKIIEIVGNKKTISADKWVNKIISNLSIYKTIIDKGPNLSAKKRISKIGYSIKTNDYFQMFSTEIHSLSKLMSDSMELNSNLTLSFNNQVNNIQKQKGIFIISTDQEDFKAKKIIFSVGRAGWKWAKDVFDKFGIIDENNKAKFGMCLEMNSSLLKDFNRSTCSLVKENEVEVGPFSWHGTIIPEDHVEMAISSFRSNEERWKTDKVFFNLIGHIDCPNSGFEQTDRLANLTFILTNERVSRERISSFMNDKSKISIISEYKWLKETLTELNQAIPDLIDKGYFHVPTITPFAPKIALGKNLESEVDGMFVCGESAGIPGLLGAAVSGAICADQVCK